MPLLQEPQVGGLTRMDPQHPMGDRPSLSRLARYRAQPIAALRPLKSPIQLLQGRLLDVRRAAYASIECCYWPEWGCSGWPFWDLSSVGCLEEAIAPSLQRFLQIPYNRCS